MNRRVAQEVFVRAALAFAVVLYLTAQAPTALAQPANTEAKEALARFETAQKRYHAGDFAGALPLFREALAGSSSPNARLYVARCLRELGQLAEAYEEMRRTAREAGEKAPTQKRYAETQRAAEAELTALEPRVARVTISLPPDAPAAAEVRLDGTPVPPDRLGQPIARDPGAVNVQATAPGRPAWSRHLSLAAGATETVEVAFAPASAPEAPARPPSGGSVRTAGFAVGAVGVAGMVVFTVAGTIARSRFNKVVDECGGSRCTDPKYDGDIDTGATYTTLANVGLAVGIGGLVGGGLMILFGGPKSPAPGTSAASGPSPQFAVGVSPRGGSISGAF